MEWSTEENQSQRTILYKEVVELGFKRKESIDNVFFNQYGFHYFIMSKKLAKNVLADWDVNKRTVRILRVNKTGDILGKINIQNLGELKVFIDFFKND